jgi:RHS repeat-associated protein
LTRVAVSLQAADKVAPGAIMRGRVTNINGTTSTLMRTIKVAVGSAAVTCERKVTKAGDTVTNLGLKMKEGSIIVSTIMIELTKKALMDRELIGSRMMGKNAMRRALNAAALVVVATMPLAAQNTLWTTGTITYDGSGNIRSMATDTYSYDAFGRVTSGTADEQRTGASNVQSYTYDAYGNRLTVTTSGTGCVERRGLPGITYGTTNHITDHSAVYDAAGNLTKFNPANDGNAATTFTYKYDSAGIMTAQSIPNGTDWRYVYTADDERLAIYSGSGVWRFTVRDLDGKVLREVTAGQTSGGTTWTFNRDHVYRGSSLLATVHPGGGVEQFHLDHLGTPRMVSDASGNTLAYHAYYPFGDELNLGTQETPLELEKFTGHERDLNTGYGNSLDYMHERYYGAALARFLSVDPVLDRNRALHDAQTWNRYTYGYNAPIRWMDATGKCPVCAVVEAEAPALEAEVESVGEAAASFVESEGQAAVEATARSLRSIDLGRTGERALGEFFGTVKNLKEAIPSLSRSTVSGLRIPDFLNRAAGILGESKNVARLSLTAQLRDYLAYSQQQGLQFYLQIREGTRLSGPLQELIKRGLIKVIEAKTN